VRRVTTLQCAIFTNTILYILVQVQKGEKVRVEVYYFRIL